MLPGNSAAFFEPIRRQKPLRNVQWIRAQSVWVAIALLHVTWPSSVLSAQTDDKNGRSVPVSVIRFAYGASSAIVFGSVIRGERSLYVVDVRSGQRLTVSIAAKEKNAAFQVYAPGARAQRREFGVTILGTALPGAAEGQDTKRWSNVLPRKGTYLVVVGPISGNAVFRLSVAIR